MHSYQDIALELLVGYGALLLLTKILGKTTISQLTTFDFIATLVLGEFVGAALYVQDTHWNKIMFAFAVWGTLIYVTEALTQKFRKTRRLFEGAPTIIIDKGFVRFDEMKKNKLDLNQLRMLLRSKDAFSFSEVEYAILEANGSLSVLKKFPNQTVTTADMNVPAKATAISWYLVMDGEVIEKNLGIIDKDRNWLEAELKKQQFNTVEDVFIAEWNDANGLFVQGY